jgi:Nucleotidyl transferase of unknown function (DUF2204)
MNRDFAEMLSALSAAGVEYLIVGAHAVALHGHLRATKDLDIWIRLSPENAAKVWTALVIFGAPLREVTREDFATPGTVYQLGIEPNRIDFINDIAGVQFDTAWANRTIATVDGVDYPVIGREDLIRNKRATARPHDLEDADALERQ